MLLISDCNLEIGAHVWSEIGLLVCSRHLIKFEEKNDSFTLAQHDLSTIVYLRHCYNQRDLNEKMS